jgi:putative transposase
MKLARETLASLEVRRPSPRRSGRQGLCLDKGFDFPEIRELAREFGYTAHIRSRGEEAHELRRSTRARARRWVVERTHSWLHRFRRILTRWEKKAANYLGMLHLACSLITWGRAGLLG